MKSVTALIAIVFACVQRLLQVASQMDNELQRAQPVFLRARIVFEDRNSRRKTLDDAGSLIVLILAVKGDVICRPFDVDVDEMPAIGVLSCRREFIVVRPV